MSKNTNIFVCSQCGYETGKWLGKCPSCGEWNSLTETVRSSAPSASAVSASVMSSQPKKLADIDLSDELRYDTGLSELNRVLGDVQDKPIVDHRFLAGVRVPDEKELNRDILDEFNAMLDYQQNKAEYEEKKREAAKRRSDEKKRERAEERRREGENEGERRGDASGRRAANGG